MLHGWEWPYQELWEGELEGSLQVLSDKRCFNWNALQFNMKSVTERKEKKEKLQKEISEDSSLHNALPAGAAGPPAADGIPKPQGQHFFHKLLFPGYDTCTPDTCSWSAWSRVF